MSMRITTLMSSRTILSDLNDNVSRLSDLQEKLSSGKQITKPSDDPYGTSRALGLRGDVAGLQQQQKNVEDGTGWLPTSDPALSQFSDAVQRVRELLVQAGNDSAGTQARASAADEIDQ